MIKKVKKGKKVWVVSAHDDEIDYGEVNNDFPKDEDDDTVTLETAEEIIWAHPEDVFTTREEAIHELTKRLIEHEEDIKEKLLFLLKESNKKGRKKIVLPQRKSKTKFKFQASMEKDR